MLKLNIISKKQYDKLIDLLKRSLDVVKTLEAERDYYKKQYDNLIDLLKRSLDVVKTLEAERDYYKRSWKDLQSFCMTFSKDKNIDFPATTKEV